MTAAVVIRPAHRNDAARIGDLLGQLGYPASALEAGDRIDQLHAAGAHVLVAAADDDVIGLVGLHVLPLLAERTDAARITALVVDAAARRGGVARALVAAAEDLARTLGCTLIEVSSGRRPERAAAHDFYRALGYVDTCDRSARYQRQLAPTDTASLATPPDEEPT